MDNVEMVLINQKGLVNAFDERVKRALQSLDAELQQLDLVRRKLEADLKDKVRGEWTVEPREARGGGGRGSRRRLGCPSPLVPEWGLLHLRTDRSLPPPPHSSHLLLLLAPQLDAIDVDTMVLNVQADGYSGEASSLRAKADSSYKTPQSWVSGTDSNIKVGGVHGWRLGVEVWSRHWREGGGLRHGEGALLRPLSAFSFPQTGRPQVDD